MNIRITDLLDGYMADELYLDPVPVPDTERIKEAAMKKVKKQRNVRPLRIALIAAAVVILLTGTVLGVVHYTKISDRMEETWNNNAETEMTSEQKDFIEQRSADIGESVTDQGITVTLESVTCTTDTVTALFAFKLDPEIYDVEKIGTCADALSLVQVENENFTARPVNGGGGGDLMENGVVKRTSQYNFSGQLPEGANLGDGKTTMSIEMNTMWLNSADGSEEIPDVTGTWSFEFLLPASEAAAPRTSDEVLNFESGVTLEVSDISVDESGCEFTVAADSDDYIFSTGGEQAELARAAEPYMVLFTVDALMEDGSRVVSLNAGMSKDQSGEDHWHIDWLTPLDPESVVSLIFSDGTTEVEISLE